MKRSKRMLHGKEQMTKEEKKEKGKNKGEKKKEKE